MIQKPFAAFGYVIIANYYKKSEQFEVNSSVDSKTLIFCSTSDITGTDRLTGRVLDQYTSGWSNYGVNVTQEYTNIVNEDSTFWCCDPKLNKGFLPKIIPQVVSINDTIELKQGTKLFLCEGTLEINGREFVGPYQIHIKTGDKSAKALTTCYGLIFE